MHDQSRDQCMIARLPVHDQPRDQCMISPVELPGTPPG